MPSSVIQRKVLLSDVPKPVYPLMAFRASLVSSISWKAPFWDTTAPDRGTVVVPVVLVAVLWRVNSLTCKLEAFTASENTSPKILLSRSRVNVTT